MKTVVQNQMPTGASSPAALPNLAVFYAYSDDASPQRDTTTRRAAEPEPQLRLFRAEVLRALRESLIVIRKPSLERNLSLMKEFVSLLEGATAKVKSGVSIRAVALEIRSGLDDVLEPGEQLGKELDLLVKAGRREAACLYCNRPDREMRAAAFLDKTYKKFLDANILHKDQLRAMDPQLVYALNKSEAQKELLALGRVLPSKSDRIKTIAEENQGLIRDLQCRLNAARRYARP